MTSISPTTLVTKRLILKTLDASFAERTCAYLTENKDFFDPWSPIAPDVFFTVSGQILKLKKDIHLMEQGQGIRFYLFLLDDENLSQVIGDFAFSQIVRGAFQSCFLGYKMAQNLNGKGLMTEALSCGIQFAFNDLRLHRIEANIIPRNAPSIRVVQKLGFEYEGLSRKYLQINGIWEDHAHYVLLNEAME